jgi:hypothetical protein
MSNKNPPLLMRNDRNLNRPTIITTPAPPIEKETDPSISNLRAIPETKPNTGPIPEIFPKSHMQKSIELIIEEEYSYTAKRRVVYKETNSGT